MRGITLAPGLTATMVALLAPAGVSAAPSVTGEFPLPGSATVGSNNEIVQGPDGNMWITTDEMTPSIVRMAPDGTATRLIPGGLAQSASGIVAGPDGNLWAAQNAGVVKISPGPPVSAAQTNYGVTGGQGITVGPDGNIWFAATGKLIKIPPATPGMATQYNVGAITGPKGMATGSDGLLWIADNDGQVISATAAATPAVTVYTPSGGVQDVAAGLNGQVAYANPGGSPQSVGLIIPGNPAQEIPLANTDPFGVVFGQDGAYWIARSQGNDLLRLTTDGTITMLGGFAPSGGVGPRKIATGPDNTLWVTLDTPEKVARVSGVDPPPPPDNPPTDNPPQPTAPDTSLDNGAKDKVKTHKRRAKVELEFSSPTPGATFECTLTKRGSEPKTQACESPVTYKLKPGRYAFAVTATADGLVDETPASDDFKVVRKRRR